jgi:hypothetical protein
LLLPAQSVCSGHRQARAAGAERMAKRDCAAVGVYMFYIVRQAEAARTGENLGREGFVDFDLVEVG